MRTTLLCLAFICLVALTGCTPTTSGSASPVPAPTFSFRTETDRDHTGNPLAWVSIAPGGTIITDIQVHWGVGNVQTVDSLVPYALDPLSDLGGEIYRDSSSLAKYFPFHPTSPALPGHINTPALVMVRWELPNGLGLQEKLVYRWQVTLATGGTVLSALRTIRPGMDSDDPSQAPGVVGGDPSLAPDGTLSLLLSEPEASTICAGIYHGFEGNNGETSVTFNWHDQGDAANITLDADFQILVQPVGSKGCKQAEEVDGLGPINDPSTEIHENDRCIIMPVHGNTTTLTLLPVTDYEWNVRQIVGEELLTVALTSTLTTAGYVTETPTFFDPNGNDTTNYPTQGEQLTLGTAVAKLVQVRWTPVGCDPRKYAIELFEDGRAKWSQQELGACYDDARTGDRICEADLGVKAGSSYQLELNQQTDFGDIDAVLAFSVAGGP